ncbi:uncharacterized protein [Rutidosis leptorrhynchoides]|uniref:uncharacterized protein n=1 Tax=Rutidosis leptorrhynchoides TaxID=125765 RepID=UPI003A997471
MDGGGRECIPRGQEIVENVTYVDSTKGRETLILYFAISKEAISSVLIAERNGVQMPIYFVSKVLQLNQPLKQILRRPESSGRLAKWAIELGEYEINFAPRDTVKGQILADFLLETNEKVEHDNKMVPQQHVWELHTDGASSEEGTGAGLVLTSPDGEKYEALLFGLRIALKMGITNLRAYVDSQIVAQQVNGKFDARDTSMRQYVKLGRHPMNIGLTSIHEKPIMTIVEGVKESWMTPYLRYLHDGGLPIDKAEARRIRVTTPMYEVINGALYRKSYNGPLLRCLTNDESLKVVKEMHEGRHGTVQRLPKYDLIPVSSAWPFYKWAIDIVGPFNTSTGNAKFLVEAIDFFIKWVEAKDLAKITGENVKKFVWHDIVCRYGVPNEIVSDNGKHFAENPFRSTVRIKSNWLGGRTAKCAMGTPENSKAEHRGNTLQSSVWYRSSDTSRNMCSNTTHNGI